MQVPNGRRAVSEPSQIQKYAVYGGYLLSCLLIGFSSLPTVILLVVTRDRQVWRSSTFGMVVFTYTASLFAGAFLAAISFFFWRRVRLEDSNTQSASSSQFRLRRPTWHHKVLQSCYSAGVLASAALMLYLAFHIPRPFESATTGRLAWTIFRISLAGGLVTLLLSCAGIALSMTSRRLWGHRPVGHRGQPSN